MNIANIKDNGSQNNPTVQINKVIFNWLSIISKDFNLEPYLDIRSLPGDASIRKYYLLTTSNKPLNNINNTNYNSNYDVNESSEVMAPYTYNYTTDTQQQFIIMQTINNKSLTNFIKLSKYLTKLNLLIKVPEILAVKTNGSLKFLLLSYLGNQLIFNNLIENVIKNITNKNLKTNSIMHIDNNLNLSYINNLSNLDQNKINDFMYVESVYHLALQRLTDLQHHPLNIKLIQMDHKYIKKYLNIFKYWYLNIHLNYINYKTEKKLNKLLYKLENYFVKVFKEQPQVFTHIDYHSKNLILQSSESLNISENQKKLNSHEIFNNKLGILDFQDAMLGPITYDIASLLQDAYIIWPEGLIERILCKHYEHLANNASQFNLQNNFDSTHYINLFKNISKEQFFKYFYLTGLQRHLKNLGIFSRLKYFYKKQNYIKYIPNLLHYIYATCNKFNDPELIELKNLLQNINFSSKQFELTL